MKDKFREKAKQIHHADMDSGQVAAPSTPFILLSSDLIVVPTPTAISIPAYRSLYQRVHASPAFCEMGFGSHFVARQWSDDETRDVVQTRDVGLSWKERGLGDFAVGLRPKDNQQTSIKSDAGRILRGGDHEIRIVDGDEYAKVVDTDDRFWDAVEWVGYAGVRDAIITSLHDVISEDEVLPPWQEMVEVRYGVAPEFWGRGVARKAADAVMLWAASEKGVRRFIAETEKTNARSGAVLTKLGFRKSGTNYWKEPDEFEWERMAN